MAGVALDGRSLSLEQVREVALGKAISISPAAEKEVGRARALIDEIAAGDEAVYGVNTGFGKLAEVRIPKDQLGTLQRNLVLSHAAGVGTPLPVLEARALLLLRINVLAHGHSGIRPATLALAVEMLNRGVVPVVPERGSVGASGDLAPLAHLALVLIGEGEAFFKGERLPAKSALLRAGLSPVVLEAKEGLALLNGTQAMCSVGTLALLRAEALAETFDVAGAMVVEGQLGSHAPFQAHLHEVRAHPGQLAAAAHLRSLLKNSALVQTHVDCEKVQDAYSLRCMPQVHGAARDGLAYARRVLEIEVNSATDNPLVFADKREVVSGGNFHGQPVSLALDVVAIALAQLAAISERRTEQLVNPQLSGLPPFLAKAPGLNSGFMIAHVTAAALASELKILAHPASVDSIPTSAGREDHVSMGMTAALKARQAVELAEHVAAVELLVAAQAIDFRAPHAPGRGAKAAHALIRKHVPFMETDREVHKDISAIKALLDSGELLAAVRGACYEPAP
jgi:histidine ammonia-lyase